MPVSCADFNNIYCSLVFLFHPWRRADKWQQQYGCLSTLCLGCRNWLDFSIILLQARARARNTHALLAALTGFNGQIYRAAIALNYDARPLIKAAAAWRGSVISDEYDNNLVASEWDKLKLKVSLKLQLQEAASPPEAGLLAGKAAPFGFVDAPSRVAI